MSAKLTLSTYSFSDIVAIIAAGANETSTDTFLDDIAHDALACHENGYVEPYANVQDMCATAYNFGMPIALGGDKAVL